MLKTITLLGVTITAEKPDKILEYVFSEIKKGKQKLFLTTPNPEMLVYANSHLDYKDKLNSSHVSLPDGIGLVLASLFLNKPRLCRFTGVDFLEQVCQRSRDYPMSMGFLGGKGGVAEKAAQRLQNKYPWIKVVWVGEEWGSGKNDTVRHSSNEPIDILFVAFGVPKQEEWIYEQLPNLPVHAATGVGGAFDYLSGRVPRAPKFVRVFGLEWLFRLILQPWRWKRQLALFKFLFLILKERFTSPRPSS